MEKLVGRVVEMIVEPGVEGVKATLGEVVFVAPFTECDGGTNALFLMASPGERGEVLYTLAVGSPERVYDNPDGYFSSTCLLASSASGRCASVAAALRKLAEHFDALELENYTPTTLDA